MDALRCAGPGVWLLSICCSARWCLLLLGLVFPSKRRNLWWLLRLPQAELDTLWWPGLFKAWGVSPPYSLRLLLAALAFLF